MYDPEKGPNNKKPETDPGKRSRDELARELGRRAVDGASGKKS